MGNKPTKEQLGSALSLIGNQLGSGRMVDIGGGFQQYEMGSALPYINAERDRKRRMEEAAVQRQIENERYMRGYMENKLARLQDQKRYEDAFARQGQWRMEDLAQRDIEKMNLRNDAALAMERDDRRYAQQEAMANRKLEDAQIEAMNRANESMLEMDARERRYKEMELPESQARVEALRTPKPISGSTRRESFQDIMTADPQLALQAKAAVDSRLGYDQKATELDYIAEYMRMKGGIPQAGGQKAKTRLLDQYFNEGFKKAAMGAN